MSVTPTYTNNLTVPTLEWRAFEQAFAEGSAVDGSHGDPSVEQWASRTRNDACTLSRCPRPLS